MSRYIGKTMYLESIKRLIIWNRGSILNYEVDAMIYIMIHVLKLKKKLDKPRRN